jgi:hypothetical protein
MRRRASLKLLFARALDTRRSCTLTALQQRQLQQKRMNPQFRDWSYAWTRLLLAGLGQWPNGHAPPMRLGSPAARTVAARQIHGRLVVKCVLELLSAGAVNTRLLNPSRGSSFKDRRIDPSNRGGQVGWTLSSLQRGCTRATDDPCQPVAHTKTNCACEGSCCVITQASSASTYAPTMRTVLQHRQAHCSHSCLTAARHTCRCAAAAAAAAAGCLHEKTDGCNNSTRVSCTEQCASASCCASHASASYCSADDCVMLLI